MTHRFAMLVGGAALLISGLLLAPPPPATAATFTPSAPGSYPIPSTPTTEVTGAGGAISDVTVTLRNLNAPVGNALDIELVAPSGKAVLLMSDGCGSGAVNGATLTFAETASAPIPQSGGCSSGSYRPTDYNDPSDPDNWPVANPVPSLNVLINDNPNGVWKLYLRDDQGGTSGRLVDGFTLTINTYPFTTLLPGRDASGPALNYPLQYGVSGQPGTVNDLQMSLRLSHSSVADLNGLLVSPSGRKVLLFSHPCTTGLAENNVTWTFSSSATTRLPTSGSGCGTGTYQPTGATSASLPAGAPAGPYGNSMAVFNGDQPNGQWQLFLADDNASGGGGYVTRFDLSLTTAAVEAATTKDTTAPNTKITKKPRSSHRHHARVAFASDDPTATFQCKLDHRRWTACTSAKRFGHLRTGRHTFKVRAIDAAGNVDQTPAKRTWRVRAVRRTA